MFFSDSPGSTRPQRKCEGWELLAPYRPINRRRLSQLNCYERPPLSLPRAPDLTIARPAPRSPGRHAQIWHMVSKRNSARNKGFCWRIVGNPYLGIVSGLSVTRPRSAAALQNSHFCNGVAGSDASQNWSYSGPVTHVFTKCENKMPASFRSSDEHGLDQKADWRGLTV